MPIDIDHHIHSRIQFKMINLYDMVSCRNVKSIIFHHIRNVEH